jgi:hypothetical protein
LCVCVLYYGCRLDCGFTESGGSVVSVSVSFVVSSVISFVLLFVDFPPGAAVLSLLATVRFLLYLLSVVFSGMV